MEMNLYRVFAYYNSNTFYVKANSKEHAMKKTRKKHDYLGDSILTATLVFNSATKKYV